MIWGRELRRVLFRSQRLSPALDRGRPQRLFAKGIAFENLLNNGSFRLVTVFNRLNCFMHIWIKRLANSRHWIQAFTTHDFIHLPLHHAQGLLQTLAIQGILEYQRPIHVIQHAQQFVQQSLLLVLHSKKALLHKLLGVLDNVDRALVFQDTLDRQGLQQALRMVQWQMNEVMRGEGLNPGPTVGEAFNPYVHEAIEAVEDHDKAEGTNGE